MRRPVTTRLRPPVMVAVAGVIVAVAGRPRSATSLLLEYQTRALWVVLTAVACAGWFWCRRRGGEWGFELVPLLAGAMAAVTLRGSLAGTPYAPGGLEGDQTFRTAAVTRFADSWHNADFTVHGLPSFYPPAYFWTLGRLADVAGVDAWRTLKWGAIATALVAPMVSYLLWRRLVAPSSAALISIVAIVVENFYEPYSWVVIVAIVPWWLEVVHGLGPQPSSVGERAGLGLVGAAMVMTYWYFFAVAAVALVVHLVSQRCNGAIDWRQLGRASRIVGVAAAGSALYWLPLAISIGRAEHPESLANRWFGASHPRLPLPMLEPTVTGAVALVGCVYIVWNPRRDPLLGGLFVWLVAAYAWYLIGAFAASVDRPLLSFRAKPLIPLVLLVGGVLGLVQLAEQVIGRLGRSDLVRVGTLLGAALAVYAGQTFVTTVRDSSYTGAAGEAALPGESPPAPSAEALQRLIERRVGQHPVLLSNRLDILALYPNFSFLPWTAHYAHPASEFSQRAGFLTDLAASADPTIFRDRLAHNEFDAIDALVLVADQDDLVYRYTTDAFPGGVGSAEVRFPTDVLAEFDLITMGDTVVVVPPVPDCRQVLRRRGC